MPKKNILFLIFTLLIAIAIFPQFSSYRFLSTAGIFEGDIEYILTPSKMIYVDGFNVYTNLSDFSNTENALSGLSGNYLVGGKTNFGNLHVADLFYSNCTMTDNISNNIETTHNDTDGDDIYDELTVDSIFIEDYSQIDNDINYFGFAFGEEDGAKIGLAYTLYNYTTEGDYDYNEFYNGYSLLNNEQLYYENYYYSDSFNMNTSYHNFLFSFYTPMSDMEMGFVLSYAFGKSKNIGLETEIDTLNGDPINNTTLDYYNYNYYDNYDNNLHIITTGLEINKEKDDYASRMLMGYSFFISPETNNYFSRYEGVDYFYFQLPTGDFIDSSYALSSSDDSATTFAYSSHTLYTGMIIQKKLERANFGIGVTYTFSITNTDQIEHFNNYEFEHFDNGNGVDDAGDYDQTTTYSYVLERNSNTMTNTFNFPVGVEFNIKDNLLFRMGSNTTFTWNHNYGSAIYTDYSPENVVTVFGDGSQTEVLTENPSIRNDTDYDDSSFEKSTVYSYGIGWKISDNFNVDIMGFATNLTNLTGWKFSVNAKL